MRLAIIAAAILSALASPAAAFDRETVAAGAGLSTFRAIYVAPVGVALSGERRVAPRDAAAKATDLHDAIETAFEGRIASAPGEGVLTIEARLTELASNHPTSADLADNPGLCRCRPMRAQPPSRRCSRDAVRRWRPSATAAWDGSTTAARPPRPGTRPTARSRPGRAGWRISSRAIEPAFDFPAGSAHVTEASARKRLAKRRVVRK